MLIRAMSDTAIGVAIGQRLQEVRLRRNMSFAELSTATGVSRQTLHSLLHGGKANLVTVIAVMRALNDLESLAPLMEEIPLSPIQLLKLKGVARKRATGTRKQPRDSPKPPVKDLDW
jgi:transcriptional regulator with XRE-family HTH domain